MDSGHSEYTKSAWPRILGTERCYAGSDERLFIPEVGTSASARKARITIVRIFPRRIRVFLTIVRQTRRARATTAIGAPPIAGTHYSILSIQNSALSHGHA